MASQSISGSCSCGNITWTSNDPPEHLDHCYCLTCQQVTGNSFMAWVGVPNASLRWTYKTKPFIYRPIVGDTNTCISERTCCGSCGSNIFLQYDLYPDKVHIRASTIKHNDFEMPRVGCHIWLRHCLDRSIVPDDGAGRYEEFDEVFQARMETYLMNKGGKPSDATDQSMAES